jgi:uncharacterized membrane protein YkvA (DUF1232 family)
MKKNQSPENEIFAEFESEAEMINNDDLNRIVSGEKSINSKSSKLDTGKFKKLINQIKLALSLVKDFKSRKYSDVPWRSIAMIAASVMYFINPFDVVPDLLPIFGYTDDALLFAAVFKSIQSDLEKYCLWKGLNPEDYF